MRLSVKMILTLLTIEKIFEFNHFFIVTSMSLRNWIQRHHNPRVPVNYELIFSICSGVSFEYLRDIFPQSAIVKLMQLPLLITPVLEIERYQRKNFSRRIRLSILFLILSDYIISLVRPYIFINYYKTSNILERNITFFINWWLMFIKYLYQYTIFFINLTMSWSRTLQNLKSLRPRLLK